MFSRGYLVVVRFVRAEESRDKFSKTHPFLLLELNQDIVLSTGYKGAARKEGGTLLQG